MPADTSLKRYSAMHIAAPWRGLNIVPLVGGSQGERQAALYFYSGLLASAPPGPASILFSAMNIGCPWRGINATPLGSVTQGERQAILHYYANILQTTPPDVTRARGTGRLIYRSVFEGVLTGIGG